MILLLNNYSTTPAALILLNGAHNLQRALPTQPLPDRQDGIITTPTLLHYYWLCVFSEGLEWVTDWQYSSPVTLWTPFYLQHYYARLPYAILFLFPIIIHPLTWCLLLILYSGGIIITARAYLPDCLVTPEAQGKRRTEWRDREEDVTAWLLAFPSSNSQWVSQTIPKIPARPYLHAHWPVWACLCLQLTGRQAVTWPPHWLLSRGLPSYLWWTGFPVPTVITNKLENNPFPKWKGQPGQ